MNQSIYTVEKLNDTTFRIDECGRDNCYLLLGTERALLIDCSIGTGELPALVRALTSLPVTVAATHAHGDHVGAGHQFDAVFVPREEITLNYRIQNLRFYRRQLVSNTMKKQGITAKNITGSVLRAKWLPMEDGKVFDLGERTVRTFRTPGHTAGDTCFLDETQKMLFVGDSVCSVLPMHTYRCLPLLKWLPSGEHILALAKEGYAVFGGHGDGRVSADLLQQQIAWVREILQAHPKNEKKHSRAYYPEFSAQGCIGYDPANLY